MPKRLPIFAITLLLAACHGERSPSPLPDLSAIEVRSVPVTRTTSGQLWVPNEVLVERGGVPGVFVALNGEARFQMVKPGKLETNRTQILSGLSGEEKLLSGDLKTVHDGSPLPSKDKDGP